MELKIKVICERLPDKVPAGLVKDTADARQSIYLGIQRAEEMIEVAPTSRGRVVFEPSFRVTPLPENKTNFLGPFAKGTPTQRFFYLSWAVKDEGGKLTRIGRVKVHLSHLRWSEVEASLRSGASLSVRLSLTDSKGGPRCGSVRDASWQA